MHCGNGEGDVLARAMLCLTTATQYHRSMTLANVSGACLHILIHEEDERVAISS